MECFRTLGLFHSIHDQIRKGPNGPFHIFIGQTDEPILYGFIRHVLSPRQMKGARKLEDLKKQSICICWTLKNGKKTPIGAYGEATSADPDKHGSCRIKAAPLPRLRKSMALPAHCSISFWRLTLFNDGAVRLGRSMTTIRYLPMDISYRMLFGILLVSF